MHVLWPIATSDCTVWYVSLCMSCGCAVRKQLNGLTALTGDFDPTDSVLDLTSYLPMGWTLASCFHLQVVNPSCKY